MTQNELISNFNALDGQKVKKEKLLSLQQAAKQLHPVAFERLTEAIKQMNGRKSINIKISEPLKVVASSKKQVERKKTTKKKPAPPVIPTTDPEPKKEEQKPTPVIPSCHPELVEGKAKESKPEKKKLTKKSQSKKVATPKPKKPKVNKAEILKARQIGVMSLGQIHEDEYDIIKWSSPWSDLIGKACFPTHLFVMGPGGTGKSGNMLKLSDHLTELGYKVLYVSGEQFGTPTFKQLAIDANIKNKNITVVDKIDESYPLKNPENYDWVVLDSKDDLKIDVEDFEQLKKRFPTTSFIALSQNNKDGTYSGKGKWRNVVDTMLECYERGKIATGEKNRWGAYSDQTLFETNINQEDNSNE